MDKVTDGEIAAGFRPVLALVEECERLGAELDRLEDATDPAELEERDVVEERFASLNEEICRSTAKALKGIGLWHGAAMIDAGLAIPHEVREDLVEQYPPYPPAAPDIELRPRRSWRAAGRS
ncbi:hypothetical protein [Glycomyces algeriensis]|uniref:Uncharacterized protein n=1 Tax=Glycomyces algeriensis TaxID=256037 RepID=A0A9W6GDE5_9ACTN|nr:hypothetical protein [Glycomyces algeriensis]MDA1367824.1 hypothetical protein [Glycomyces algeriensis]MDR7351970.1 uncharacterized small protein (DUF1192 family) [Glycomyces algeriensis]GLI44703.1 hypothetical protein GALLR39Z86_45530 [Glycomyces algeriensis]